MQTETPELLALNLISLSIIVFTCHLLLLRSEQKGIRVPLILTMVSLGLVIGQPTVVFLNPQWQIPLLILSLPALLLIPVCLYWYTLGLTQVQPWQFNSRQWRHALIPALGLIIALTALALPNEIIESIFTTGDEAILQAMAQPLRALSYTLLIGTFILVMLWVGLSAAYLVAIIKRLRRYRRHLKDLFASTENKELRWLSGLAATLLTLWLLSAITLIIDNLWFPFSFAPWLQGSVLLAFIWTLAIWGLRQKPGLLELAGQPSLEETAESSQNPANELAEGKYQRSALTQDHATRIATKIQHAMQQDKLYLEPDLSLHKLAKHISTSPNYISQTLNQVLKMNFFDYVNHHRVNAAKQQLKNSNDTVLDIAMTVGFNAKSSFYTAFKKACGQTPTEFRKQH